MLSIKFMDAVILILGILINVAFITLLERKILGYSQSRLGPNKVSFSGLLQPMADAVKLFLTKPVLPFKTNFLFSVMPMMGIFLALMSWQLFPTKFHSFSVWFSVIFLLVFMSATVYPLLLMGWSSKSKYSILGGVRSIAQTISYEVSLTLIFLIIILFSFSFSFSDYVNLQNWQWMLVPSIFLVWLLSCVAETGRTPFDFAEGESELVSGFNTEFSGNKFALIFMAEYTTIYFFSALSSLVFITNKILNLAFISVIIIFWWVWLRATFPRYRYDLLMNLNWKIILPLIINLVFFSLFMSFF